VLVNPSVATGQFIMRSGFTVTGTATVQNGILGVASGNTASGGEIQVKFNTNAQDAVLNLGGDFTATGNVAITNANFVGGNLNQINLLGTRIFNIAAGTTTTVRPTVDGTGGLTKIGNGTLDLRSTASYTGDTLAAAGTLRTSTLQTNTASVTVADNATLSVRIPQPGTTLTTPAFTLGTGATGAKLIIDLNGLGNPAAAPLTAPAFTANGSSEITILGAVTNGVFPLIDYDGAIGGAGIGSFTLKLPLRVAGVLQNNAVNTSVDVNILGVDNPHWNGNLSSDWDIDNGSGTGTANWKTAVSNTATRYLQGAGGTDHVVFDDGATGSTSVNLTTTIAPLSVTFDNTTKNYTLVGSGKLSGTTALTKRGAGMLTIANTATNDYSGGTTIETGALRVGDGVTAGAGTLGTAAITNDGTLILDRPDDFTLPNVIAGSGTLVKNGAGIATLAAVPTFFGATTINTGTLAMSFTGSFNSAITNNSVLQLDNAVTLAGAISGPGTLVAQGAGTKMISGGDANTYNGLTTVSSGTLSLNKVPGVNAVGGDIRITGSGVLAITSPDQIPDSATITHTGSANSTLANETVATVVVNTTAGAQIIANTGLVVSNAVLLQNGVFSVASGHSSTVNQVIMSGGTLRVAANTAASTLTIGGGGIITTGGVIEVGNGAGAFDAVMILGGDLTASATLNINRGGFTGAEKREIDLGAAVRNFDITAGTTTVRPDLVGAGGGIAKTGNGTLAILGSQSYSSLTTDGGITNLQTPLPNATITNTSGTLNVNANATNSAIVANATTNFSTSQTLASLTIGASGVVTLAPSPGLEPGAALASEFLTEGDSVATASTGAPLQAVPEPGAPSLLAAGLLSLLARRRRPAAK
jgi:autotransporter-associated beta strand protein